MVLKNDAEKYPFAPRANKPGMPEHLREPMSFVAKDVEKEPFKYIALALIHLRQQIGNLVNMIADHSRPVDEYNTQGLAPELIPVGGNIEVQALYETAEIIEFIVITGPPAGTCQLQLGDRLWSLVIPATGILSIGAPMVLTLDRQDRRVLTVTGTAGEWTLELMGHADGRGNLV